MPGGEKHSSIIMDTAVAIAPAAAAYFAGWAYLAQVLRPFGLDVTEPSLPLNTVLVFSVRPLARWEIVPILLLWLYAALLVRARRRKEPTFAADIPGFVWVPMLAIILFASAALINEMARESAADFIDSVWDGGRPVAMLPLASEDTTPATATTATTTASATAASADAGAFGSAASLRAGYRACRTRTVQILALTDRTYLLCPDRGDSPAGGSVYVLDGSRNLVSVRRVWREQ